MKRKFLGIVFAVLVVFLWVGISGAVLDDNSTNQNQGQGQGQDQGQAQGQAQGQGQDQAQLQGQLQGQGQGQGQGQIAAQGQLQGNVGIQEGNTTSVSVEGDTNKNKAYAFAPPAMNAEKGTAPLNAYSIFGGVGISETEEYSVAIEKISVIERMETLGYISGVEAKEEARKAFEQLKDSTKTKRFLGLFWQTRGRNLLNGFGLLAWDSFWKDGQHPFTKTDTE